MLGPLCFSLRVHHIEQSILPLYSAISQRLHLNRRVLVINDSQTTVTFQQELRNRVDLSPAFKASVAPSATNAAPERIYFICAYCHQHIIIDRGGGGCSYERMFSEVGDLLEPKRRKFSPQLLSAMYCVRSWLREGFVVSKQFNITDVNEEVIQEIY